MKGRGRDGGRGRPLSLFSFIPTMPCPPPRPLSGGTSPPSVVEAADSPLAIGGLSQGVLAPPSLDADAPLPSQAAHRLLDDGAGMGVGGSSPTSDAEDRDTILRRKVHCPASQWKAPPAHALLGLDDPLDAVGAPCGEEDGVMSTPVLMPPPVPQRNSTAFVPLFAAPPPSVEERPSPEVIGVDELGTPLPIRPYLPSARPTQPILARSSGRRGKRVTFTLPVTQSFFPSSIGGESLGSIGSLTSSISASAPSEPVPPDAPPSQPVLQGGSGVWGEALLDCTPEPCGGPPSPARSPLTRIDGHALLSPGRSLSQSQSQSQASQNAQGTPPIALFNTLPSAGDAAAPAPVPPPSAATTTTTPTAAAPSLGFQQSPRRMAAAAALPTALSPPRLSSSTTPPPPPSPRVEDDTASAAALEQQRAAVAEDPIEDVSDAEAAPATGRDSGDGTPAGRGKRKRPAPDTKGLAKITQFFRPKSEAVPAPAPTGTSQLSAIDVDGPAAVRRSVTPPKIVKIEAEADAGARACGEGVPVSTPSSSSPRRPTFTLGCEPGSPRGTPAASADAGSLPPAQPTQPPSLPLSFGAGTTQAIVDRFEPSCDVNAFHAMQVRQAVAPDAPTQLVGPASPASPQGGTATTAATSVSGPLHQPSFASTDPTATTMPAASAARPAAAEVSSVEESEGATPSEASADLLGPRPPSPARAGSAGSRSSEGSSDSINLPLYLYYERRRQEHTAAALDAARTPSSESLHLPLRQYYLRRRATKEALQKEALQKEAAAEEEDIPQPSLPATDPCVRRMLRAIPTFDPAADTDHTTDHDVTTDEREESSSEPRALLVPQLKKTLTAEGRDAWTLASQMVSVPVGSSSAGGTSSQVAEEDDDDEEEGEEQDEETEEEAATPLRTPKGGTVSSPQSSSSPPSSSSPSSCSQSTAVHISPNRIPPTTGTCASTDTEVRTSPVQARGEEEEEEEEDGTEESDAGSELVAVGTQRSPGAVPSDDVSDTSDEETVEHGGEMTTPLPAPPRANILCLDSQDTTPSPPQPPPKQPARKSRARPPPGRQAAPPLVGGGSAEPPAKRAKRSPEVARVPPPRPAQVHRPNEDASHLRPPAAATPVKRPADDAAVPAKKRKRSTAPSAIATLCAMANERERAADEAPRAMPPPTPPPSKRPPAKGRGRNAAQRPGRSAAFAPLFAPEPEAAEPVIPPPAFDVDVSQCLLGADRGEAASQCLLATPSPRKRAAAATPRSRRRKSSSERRDAAVSAAQWKFAAATKECGLCKINTEDTQRVLTLGELLCGRRHEDHPEVIARALGRRTRAVAVDEFEEVMCFHTGCLRVASLSLNDMPELARALQHAEHADCAACCEPGATVECAAPGCHQRYHFPCALLAPDVKVRLKAGKLWCPRHAGGA